MRRQLLLALALALGAGLVLLFSAPAGANPNLDDPDMPVKLEGTTWVGQDGEYVTTFRFDKGGVLTYAYVNGTYRNGTWKQTGDKLYFEMNNKFREFRGTIKGEKIEGNSWNIRDMKWKTVIYKMRDLD